jgi:hypothetical protein
VPLIQACGVTTEQFFNYTIDGTPYNYSSPADSFYMYVNPQTTPAQITISGSRINSGTSTSGFFSFDQPGIAVGSAQNMTSIYLSQITGTTTINNTISVNITEYGAVGEFIAGNFSGSITGPSPTFTVYNINGSFRVRRSQ